MSATQEATTSKPNEEKATPPEGEAEGATKATPPKAEDKTIPKVDVPEQDDDDVLDLVPAITPRKLVKVPTRANPTGEAFEIRLLDDFGIVEQQKLLNMSRRFEELWNAEKELTDDEGLTMKHLLDTMFDRIMVASKEQKEEFSDAMRGRVVTAFTLAPLLARQQQQEREEAEKEKEQEETTDSQSSEEK